MGGGSSAGGSASLQQLDHQVVLQRLQLAAVVLLQDRRQLAAEARQARRRLAVRHVEQRVEDVQPQVAVRLPVGEGEAFEGRPTLASGVAKLSC